MFKKTKKAKKSKIKTSQMREIKLPTGSKELEKEKEELIMMLIGEGFLHTPSVISAFRRTSREHFVPKNMMKHAYVNEPFPIGHGQTISQPLTVAVMTEALEAKDSQVILEVGTGSGYQAAILSLLVGERGKVITTERIPELTEMAKKNLKDYRNVEVVNVDGSQGYEKYAPYDRIIVTASAQEIPEPLLNQLKIAGKLVIPIGNELWLIEKTRTNIKKTTLGYYAFVPLIGEHGYKE